MANAPRELRSTASARASQAGTSQPTDVLPMVPHTSEPQPLAHRTTELSLSARMPQRPHLDARLKAIAAQLPDHLQAKRVIGEGGSSVVLEAFHTRLKVSVAVKVLAMRGELAEAAQQRMLREAELYARLDDPRVPRVYDVNELPDGTPYVVMEMVPGSSLELLLAQTRCLQVPLALHIARELLLALRSVHARGVLHRDIKPANVILSFEADGSCQVRLVDFGIAKTVALSGPQVALTQRGALVGTPQYMAPERLTGQEADLSSETYGVGVLLYEMLAGVVPFGGHNLGAIMAAVLRDTPEPLRNLRNDLPADLDALVMRSIARDPSQRFANAQSMLDALELVQQSMSSGDGSAVRRRPVSEPVPAPVVQPWSETPDQAEPVVLLSAPSDSVDVMSTPTHNKMWRRALIVSAMLAAIVTGWVLFERLQHGVPLQPTETPLQEAQSPLVAPQPTAPSVQRLPATPQPAKPIVQPRESTQTGTQPALQPQVDEMDRDTPSDSSTRRKQRRAAQKSRAAERSEQPVFNYVEPRRQVESAPADLPNNPY